MKTGVVGIGFVGLPLAAALASMGSRVWCLDQDVEKIANLKNGILPISEPGLEPLVSEGVKKNLLIFTTNYEEMLAECDIVFIAVGTPPGADGSADLRYVKSVAETVGRLMTRELIVINKSTVPVGTAELVKGIVQKNLDARGEKLDFWVVSNPEFMAEGRAVADMLNPSRVVVGTDDLEVMKKLRALYAPFMKREQRFHQMGVTAAELTKYASNSMLALKISFINTIAMLSEMCFADVREVAGGMGSDPRIGPEFLYPSLGYGGSCFPKDVKALIAFAKKMKIPLPYIKLLEAIEEVNEYQKTVIPRKIIAKFGNDLSGMKFAVWGLAFKAQTNDMRESAAINIVVHLVGRGATVVAYDPLATEEAKKVYLKDVAGVTYEDTDKYSILPGCDALIIATETGEYRLPDLESIKGSLNSPVIFDGRNILDVDMVHSYRMEYYAIGRGDRIEWQDIEL